MKKSYKSAFICVPLIKHGVIRIHLKTLLILFISQIAAINLYCDPVAEMFNTTFASSPPVIETSELNGSKEVKLSYLTKAPFTLLKNYYEELFRDSEWKIIPLHSLPFAKNMLQLNSNLNLADENFNQLYFLNGESILTVLYQANKHNDENFISLSLRDKFPLFNINIDDIDLSIINNALFSEATPLLDFHSKSENFSEIHLSAFETSADKLTILDFYQNHLLHTGWKKLPLMETFRKEINSLLSRNTNLNLISQNNIFTDAFKNMIIFQNKQGNFLFFYVYENLTELKTHFGYFIKKQEKKNG